MSSSFAQPDRRIGVTVLTGFLGGGKTTLLNRLIVQEKYARSLVIINEFGEVGVDHALVRGVRDDVVLLKNGCICCTVRGGLVDALRDMFLAVVQRKIEPFDHVLIEASGMADAAPILFTLRHDFFLADRYVLDSCVAVLNARYALDLFDRHAMARRQIVLADQIAIAQFEGMHAEDLRAVCNAVTQINPTASAVLLPQSGPVPPELVRVGPYRSSLASANPQRLREGQVSPSVSVQPAAFSWLGGSQVSAPFAHWRNSDSAGDVHTFSVCHGGVWSRRAFQVALDACLAQLGADLLRMKGIVRFEGQHYKGRAYAVHAVHQQYYPSTELIDTPLLPGGCILVFIVQTNDVKVSEAFVRGQFDCIAG